MDSPIQGGWTRERGRPANLGSRQPVLNMRTAKVGLTFGRRSPGTHFVGYAFVDDTDLIIKARILMIQARMLPSNAASPGLMGRRHSSYRRRNCGKVSLGPYRFQVATSNAGRYVTELSAGTTQGPPVRRQRSRPRTRLSASDARRTLRSQTGTDGRSVRVMAEPTSLLQPVQGAELCNC
jgi:hypothetical protein